MGRCEVATCTTGHVCSKCKEQKACGQYYRRRSAGAGGRDRTGERVPVCKQCQSAARVGLKRKDPAAQRAYMNMWRYGLSEDDLANLLAAQGGKCAIEGCGATEPGGRGSFHVDHNHACCPGIKSCGRCIRGLLCHSCNTALGLFKDNASLMRKAAEYVEREM